MIIANRSNGTQDIGKRHNFLILERGEIQMNGTTGLWRALTPPVFLLVCSPMKNDILSGLPILLVFLVVTKLEE
jgi:hypothetical protein